MKRQVKSNAEIWLMLHNEVDVIEYTYDTTSGNVSTEKWYKRGDVLLTVKYTYDAQNRVTKVERA